MDRNSKEYKTLVAKWEKKLEESGLENIEQPDGNLKLWASQFFKVRYDATVFEAKEQYYRLAGQFLNDYRFEDKLDKQIWKMHAEGMSIRTIVKLRRKGNKAINRNSIHRRLQELTKTMLEQTRQDE